jgi:hypothetical protein
MWLELWAKDPKAMAQFYAGLAGYEIAPVERPDGSLGYLLPREATRCAIIPRLRLRRRRPGSTCASKMKAATTQAETRRCARGGRRRTPPRRTGTDGGPYRCHAGPGRDRGDRIKIDSCAPHDGRSALHLRSSRDGRPRRHLRRRRQPSVSMGYGTACTTAARGWTMTGTTVARSMQGRLRPRRLRAGSRPRPGLRGARAPPTPRSRSHARCRRRGRHRAPLGVGADGRCPEFNRTVPLGQNWGDELHQGKRAQANG